MKTVQKNVMNKTEKLAMFSLSSVFALRMLGLFMLLPVFAIAGQQYQGYTPVLIGFAIGAYGLTQAILQIPFGWLSDRYGRKPIIVIGLLIFAAGSLLAAYSEHIYGVIIARLLQGAGAIASVIMALAADLSSNQQRSKMMAGIGISIGGAFAMAMVLGPGLTHWLGIKSVFLITAGLALIAVLVIYFITPDVPHNLQRNTSNVTPAMLKTMLVDPQLIRLNVGIFLLHFILTAFFVVLPLKLTTFEISLAQHSWIYLLTLLLSVLIMLPLLILSEKKRQHRATLMFAILLIAGVLLGFAVPGLSLQGVVVCVMLFFVGFNLLEALLPSILSRIAPLSGRGSALGVYSSAQFMGAFLGGPIAGLLLKNYGQTSIYYLTAMLAIIWFCTLMGFKGSLNPISALNK